MVLAAQQQFLAIYCICLIHLDCYPMKEISLYYQRSFFLNWSKRQRREALGIFYDWFQASGIDFIRSDPILEKYSLNISLVIVCGTKFSFIFVPDDSIEFLQMIRLNTRNYCYSWLVLNFQHVTSWPMGTQGCLCMFCLPRCIRGWPMYTNIYILWIKCNRRIYWHEWESGGSGGHQLPFPGWWNNLPPTVQKTARQ